MERLPSPSVLPTLFEKPEKSMNISVSSCNSGGESGWTSYLDQSSCSASQCQRDHNRVKHFNDDEEEEEEDLSMLSDASSGPRHFNEDEESYFSENECSNSAQKRKMAIKKNGSSTDDTASSTVLGFNKKSSAPSNDRTQFKGKSAFHNCFGPFQSIPQKPAPKKPGKL